MHSPPHHPLRVELSDEVHARPREALCAALRMTFLGPLQRPSRALPPQVPPTCVDISRERQNQRILESMSQRVEARLRLQRTVEGLSAATITCRVVGLAGHAAKGLRALAWHVNAELAMGLSIPIVAAIRTVGMRHVRKVVTRATN